jgi:hypothetical protein|tara:strand:- start:198 stop:3161 length:2964 start_codon:yes stop_codon:yes gene_type:complete
MASYGGGRGGSRSPDPVEVRRAELEKGWNEYKKTMSVQEPSVDNMAAVGVFYNPSNKQWNVTREKTNFKTDFEVRNKVNTNFKTVRVETLSTRRIGRGGGELRYYITLRFDVQDGDGNVIHTGKEETYAATEEYTGYGRGSRRTGKIIIDRYASDDIDQDIEQQERDANTIKDREQKIAKVENEYIGKHNKIANEYNEKGKALNSKNTAKNAVYDQIVDNIARNTKGSDYLTRRGSVENLKDTLTNAGISSGNANSIISTLKNEYKSFYRTEKLQAWDSKLGAKPPYGDFDPSYYAGVSPTANATWNSAVSNDDIDITERYTNKNGFLLYHYTAAGKPAGLRGNRAENTEQANAYLEKAPTDSDLQAVRDLQLGIAEDQAERLLAVPEIAEQWELARQGDPYWKNLAKENFLDIEEPDQFAALFRLSDREEDKQIKFNLNLNAGYGITDLEDAINQAVGEKALVDVTRFGALTQNVLKDTIEEMKKAKAQEQELDLFRGFGGFEEIMNINEELTNSIMGDSGVGGVLAFTSGDKAEKSLETAIGNLTGVGNNVAYNWQNWFDNELQKQYEGNLELGYTKGEAEKEIAVEAEFAKNFINDYLVPRFDTSRSMDEFIEYLDVRQEEQNPFQTQDIVNAVQQVARLRSEGFLDQLKDTADRGFNADFYFDPKGDDARVSEYAKQKEEVASDWDKARFGTPEEKAYWASQAYRFGLDINDKESFAKIHFQIKGQGKGYDGADDILNASKVRNKIFNDILPALEDEALEQGTVFGQFVKPEEFAEELLQGINPEDEEYQEILDELGIDEFTGTVDELKEYIVEALRGGSAQLIRENIKYLNEKREKPTQKELGITYIERDEDYAPEKVKAETQLYKVFTNAGFQGTEDEFYEEFFPDTDRSEQILLSKGGTNEGLEMIDLDFSDPFAAFGTVQGFFDDDEKEEKERERRKEDKEKKGRSYFSLNLDDDDDEDYKSKSGQEILGEFTSIFKGF